MKSYLIPAGAFLAGFVLTIFLYTAAFAGELGRSPGTVDKSDSALVYDCIKHPDLDKKLVEEGQKLMVVGDTEGGNGFVVTYNNDTSKGYVLHIDVAADQGCIIGNIKGGLIVFQPPAPSR